MISVVQISVQKKLQNIKGSAFIAEFKKDLYLLTCAHCVDSSDDIIVENSKASIEFISTKFDIAILSVDNNLFWENKKPLKLSEKKTNINNVNIIGYPNGVSDLSTISGNVCQTAILFNNINILDMIDISINPGNSGGPVMNKDLVIGIVIANQANICYMIPVYLIIKCITAYQSDPW